MATNDQIRDYVKEHYEFVAHDCWIAHAKEISGIPVRQSHRRSGKRKKPCPANKLKPIQEAFLNFGMME